MSGENPHIDIIVSDDIAKLSNTELSKRLGDDQRIKYVIVRAGAKIQVIIATNSREHIDIAAPILGIDKELIKGMVRRNSTVPGVLGGGYIREARIVEGASSIGVNERKTENVDDSVYAAHLQLASFLENYVESSNKNG